MVDGVERDRRLIDDNNGGCRTAVHALGCPASPASNAAAYDFDTTTLPRRPTRHVVVRDATEANQATYGPVSVTIDKSPRR